MLAADEVSLTNSIMGVMPVCRVERHAVGGDKPGPTSRGRQAGADKPGPVTVRLGDAYAREVEGRGSESPG